MQSTEFGAEDWIERLARALGKLSAAQEPYLQEYYRQHPRVHDVSEEPGNNTPAFPLDDVRDLYAMAHHSHVLGKRSIMRRCARCWTWLGIFYGRIPCWRGS